MQDFSQCLEFGYRSANNKWGNNGQPADGTNCNFFSTGDKLCAIIGSIVNQVVFLLGLISSFSLPPYDIFYLNFISYPAFLWILLIYPNDKVKSFNVGWTFGFGYFISSLFMVIVSCKNRNIRVIKNIPTQISIKR